MSYSPGQNYRLSYTIAIALAFHAVAILFIVFNAESNTSTRSQMEVTLSYHNSDEKPDNADFIAASNQQGSGDSKKIRLSQQNINRILMTTALILSHLY